MNILDLIKTDHRKVESLFAEIDKSDAPHKLQTLFNQLYKELSIHTEAEELTLYPALREYEDTDDLLEEAEEEHTEAKELLEEIKSLNPSSSEFKERISELKNAVQHHVQEEENNIFSVVRECMDKSELNQLGTEFTEAKSRLQQEISL